MGDAEKVTLYFLIAGAIVAFCIFLLVELHERHYRCTGSGTVVAVGACSRYGYCGVLLDNGSKTEIAFPVVGSKTCIKKEWVW